MGAALRDAINEALAKRSVAGVFAYLVLLAIFFVATRALQDHSSAALIAIGWMVALSTTRLRIAGVFVKCYHGGPTRWARQFRVATLLAGLSWGTGCALWTHAMGIGASSTIMLVSSAGIAAGAMSSLGPSLRLARAYVVCVLAPTIIDLALWGDHSRVTIGFALILLLYLAFLVVETKHVNEGFVLAVRRSFLLEQRSNALAERTQRMKDILDTVGQGFLSITPDGQMADERSAVLERWLGPIARGEPVWAYLGRVAPDAASWLELGFDELRAGLMPSELVVAQLPRSITIGERDLEIAYRLTFDREKLETVLMIVSDVTDQVKRLRSEQEQRELLSVFQRITADRSGVVDFVNDADCLTTQLAGDVSAPSNEVLRWLHTLKGNVAMFGLEDLSRVCHDLESTLNQSGEQITLEQRVAIARAWQGKAERIRALLGGDKPTFPVTVAEYSALVASVEAKASHLEISRALRRWKFEPAESRLLGLAQHARSLARRLDKGDIAVIVESNGLRLPPERFGAFWAAFVHVVRNAIDHGLELPVDRIAVGKTPAGTLKVQTFVDESDLVVSLEDDGRGIDWGRVAAAARTRGLAHETSGDLESVLFADGLSTKESATELSGRGVGLGAVLSEVRVLGGMLTVSSEAGLGTRCVARFPKRMLDLPSVDDIAMPVAS